MNESSIREGKSEAIGAFGLAQFVFGMMAGETDASFKVWLLCTGALLGLVAVGSRLVMKFKLINGKGASNAKVDSV